MIRRILISIVGLICLTSAATSGAQKGATVPAEVCQAIEQYVAQINTAGTLKEKAARDESCAAALKALNEVLKRYGKNNLSAQASEFAKYSELVASTDPTDANFGELVSKRLKSRAVLQELCMPYTTGR
jgi:hypothetical protein